MTLSDAQREEFLVEHIPYKLDAIDIAGWVADFLIRHGRKHRTTIQIGNVATIQMEEATLFTSAVGEHGFMACRAMLECLGIGLTKTQDRIASKPSRWSNTVTLLHFGLDLVTEAQVTDCLKGDPLLLDGLVQTIRAAHMGGAHLTVGSDKLSSESLVAGCIATRELVDHFLYRQLGRPVPASKIRQHGAGAT